MTKSTDLEQVYLLVVRFLMLSKKRAMESSAQEGLTSMQAMLLFLLDEARPMYSFKQVFNCDASNITGIVDGLEQKKLASRYTSEADRRIKMVRLTAKGSSLRNKLLAHAAGSTSLLAKLSPKELEDFTLLLKKITNGSNVL